MLGFELNETALKQNSAFADSGAAASIFVVKKLMSAGLLTVPAGANVVRWLPALNVSDAEVDEALQTMETVLKELES